MKGPPWRQVVEVAEELVESVNGRQIFIEIAEVVLAKLSSFVAHGLERRRKCHCLRGDTDLGARLADRRHACANGEFAGDELGAPSRATGLGIIVCKAHPLGGHLVEVWRPACH